MKILINTSFDNKIEENKEFMSPNFCHLQSIEMETRTQNDYSFKQNSGNQSQKENREEVIKKIENFEKEENNKNIIPEDNKQKTEEKNKEEVSKSMKRSRALKKLELGEEKETLEPDESIMEAVLRNFGKETKNQLKQMLSKDCLDMKSIDSESKKDSLLKANRLRVTED